MSRTTNYFALFSLLVLGLSPAKAQEPDVDPSGNAGALKAQVETGGSYSPYSGNASRSVTDMQVPGAVGDGLAFTRHWNSTEEGAGKPFATGGWTHSWNWYAERDLEEYVANEEEYPRWAGITFITHKIHIAYPDGQIREFYIQLNDRDYHGGGTAWQPVPWPENWASGLGLADHVGGMANDGSAFLLYLADGGSVRFQAKADGYRATEVIDPHGLKTILKYKEDAPSAALAGYNRLEQVIEPAGRTLDIHWEYVGASGDIPKSVISSVTSGAQAVNYTYSRFPYTWVNPMTGAEEQLSWYALTRVTYANETNVEAIYNYEVSNNFLAGFTFGPVLVKADDPHFAGPMTRIQYDYLRYPCDKWQAPNPPPPTQPTTDYFYPHPLAITAERSGTTNIPGTTTGQLVSALNIGCFDGRRTETRGAGGQRIFSYGYAGGNEPGSYFVQTFNNENNHWVPPEAGPSLGYTNHGYELSKLGEFSANPATAPSHFERYYYGYPRRLFDGKGTLTEMITSLDGSGHVTQVRNVGSDQSTRTYNWTASGSSAPQNFIDLPNPYPHWLFSQTDERNQTTTYTRDSRRRVTRIDYADGSYETFDYDLHGFNQVIAHRLPSGTTKHYSYDDRGLLLQEWNDVDGLANATIYTYDLFDRVATVSHPWSRNKGATFSLSLTYNGRHQVVREEYPATNGGTNPFKTYEYDAYGNCTAITDEMGHRSRYEYDSYRRCVFYAEPLNATDWEGGSTVAERTWNWIYDRWDGTTLFDAATHTSKQWRVQIEPEFNSAHDRRLSARKYDANDRVIEEYTGLWQAGDGSWHSGADTEVHQFTYDENGQKSSYTDPQNRVTTYNYDNRNRLWKTNETVNTIPRTTETLYDVAGNKTMVKFPVEAAGQRTQQWLDYDAFGQAGRFIDERGNTTNLTYCWGPMKKLYTVTTHRDEDGGGTEEDQQTVFSYDLMGRPTQVLFPDHSHEDSGYLHAQLHTWSTRKGQTKTFDYDARGREISHTWDDGMTPGINRTWDDANRLTVIWNSVSTVDFGYDSAGQPLWEGDNIVGSGSYTHINYLRYPNGAVSYMQYPNNLWVHHNYTARGQLKNVLDWNYGYWKPTLDYYYLYDGKVTWQDYSNGVQTSFHYDGRGMVEWLHHHRVSPYQNLAWREYTRDERDRIISWKAGSDNSVNPLQDGRGHRFAYDPEGQLTDAWYGPYDPANSTDGTVREDHFNYDALGNRRGSNWQGWDGAINYLRKDTRLNQYRSWQPYSPVINYDDDFGPPWGAPSAANGVVMQDGYITASYNALNQPNAIWAPAFGSSYLWLGYDPLGRCVKRWIDPGDGSASGGLRYFYYDGWNLIEDGSSPWNPEHFYVNGSRMDEIVASYTWGVPSYHHFDANGNCMTLTNAAGNITEQYYYDAFGKPYIYDAVGNWLPGSPSGNRFFFTGREYINELKLYDYRNRLYNPQMGRFLQPDPKEFGAGDYNLYRYCHNDPVNKSDPLGLAPGDPFGSPEAAARDVHNFINPTSIKQNAEYGSVIYQVGDKFYASPTFTNGAQTHVTVGTEVDKSRIPENVRSQATRAGDYHSHGDYSKNLINPKDGTSKVVRASKSENPQSDHPSQPDNDRARIILDKAPNYKLFLGTPSGELKRYDGKKDKPL